MHDPSSALCLDAFKAVLDDPPSRAAIKTIKGDKAISAIRVLDQVDHIQLQVAITLTLRQILDHEDLADDLRMRIPAMKAIRKISRRNHVYPSTFLLLPSSVYLPHMIQSGWGGHAMVYKGEYQGQAVAVKLLHAHAVTRPRLPGEIIKATRVRMPYRTQHRGYLSAHYAFL